jgi:hypothetical protein
MLFSIHILQYEQYNLIHSFDNQSRQASSSHSIPNQLLFYYYCKRIICTNSRYLYVWQNKNNRKTKNRHGRIPTKFRLSFYSLNDYQDVVSGFEIFKIISCLLHFSFILLWWLFANNSKQNNIVDLMFAAHLSWQDIPRRSLIDTCFHTDTLIIRLSFSFLIHNKVLDLQALRVYTNALSMTSILIIKKLTTCTLHKYLNRGIWTDK